MKARTFVTCALTLAVGAFAFSAAPAPLSLPSAVDGVQQAQAAAKKKPAKPTAAAYKKFKKSTAQFSVDLFKRSVAKQGDGKNTVISPISVLNALTLMANGASGKTRVEMRNVLAGGEKVGWLDKNIRWFNYKLVNTSKAKLSLANAIWYRNDGTVKIKKGFLKSNKKYLGADIKKADFSSPATVKSINSWVSKKTNKMIKKIVDELTPDDKSVLVNALYFKAKWAAPYDSSDTVKDDFTPAVGEKHEVEMMWGKERRYISGAGVTGFIKPYAKGYSFVALLPEEGVSLADFAAGLTGSSFTKLVKNASMEPVKTKMPKLDLTFSDEALESTLVDMGLARACDEERANFSRMGTTAKGNLHIGQVIHKTRLKLDEDGTEAAAVTAVIAKASGAAFGQKPKEVILDRPYVFAIVDDSTKLPLFMGAVNDVR